MASRQKGNLPKWYKIRFYLPQPMNKKCNVNFVERKAYFREINKLKLGESNHFSIVLHLFS